MSDGAKNSNRKPLLSAILPIRQLCFFSTMLYRVRLTSTGKRNHQPYPGSHHFKTRFVHKYPNYCHFFIQSSSMSDRLLQKLKPVSLTKTSIPECSHLTLLKEGVFLFLFSYRRPVSMTGIHSVFPWKGVQHCTDRSFEFHP